MPKKYQASTNAVVLYLRVSTEEQGKSGLGLEAQLELCKSVCEKFKYTIAGIFEEIGISGKIQPLERPQFKSAIAAAKKAKGRIMVAKLDRLSRNLHQATGFLDGVYDCPEILIAENPTASMLELRLKALIAQEERDMIAARTKAALAEKKKQGVELGKSGRDAHSIKSQTLTNDSIERAIALRAEGLSVQKIADILNREGFTTSRGSEWSQQALQKRLKSVVAK